MRRHMVQISGRDSSAGRELLNLFGWGGISGPGAGRIARLPDPVAHDVEPADFVHGRELLPVLHQRVNPRPRESTHFEDGAHTGGGDARSEEAEVYGAWFVVRGTGGRSPMVFFFIS